MRGKYYIYEDVNGKFFFDGVYIPKSIIDDFVVMRYIELEKAGTVKRIEKRATRKWQGNFGCDALLEKYGRETAIQMMERSIMAGKKKEKKSKIIKKNK